MHTFLQQLNLINFKNYDDASLDFSAKINCFAGLNGIGKTNLLDAVYYLSLCKSFFSNADQQNVKHNKEFFVIQGEYMHRDQTEKIYCGVKIGQRKIFRRNDKEYDRLSEHIGLLPVVMISPADSSLILEGSEERRKFIDSVLSQFDPQYLDHLIRYNRAIIQRNQLLKEFAFKNWFDASLLEVWNEHITTHGNWIFEKRKLFIRALIPVFQHYYEFVSEGNEKVQLEYYSQLNDGNFSDLLIDSVERDRKLQYTSTGVHKDDLLLQLEEYPIKRIGSQGQQKTYLVALKLAQFDFIKSQANVYPILLLDDIFDKFDERRVEKIIQLVASDHFGQIFITDTSQERMKKVLNKINSDFRLFHIQINGVIETITENF